MSGDAVDIVARLKEESDVPLRSQASLSLNWAPMAAGLADRLQVTIFPVISGRSGTSPILGGAADFRPRAAREPDARRPHPGARLSPHPPVMASSGSVLHMRLVVEADDYDDAVRFYRDVLGGEQELQVHGDAGERVTILDVGRATLELSSPEQVDMIDRVEVGRRVSPSGWPSRSRTSKTARTTSSERGPSCSPRPPAPSGRRSTPV